MNIILEDVNVSEVRILRDLLVNELALLNKQSAAWHDQYELNGHKLDGVDDCLSVVIDGEALVLSLKELKYDIECVRYLLSLF